MADTLINFFLKANPKLKVLLIFLGLLALLIISSTIWSIYGLLQLTRHKVESPPTKEKPLLEKMEVSPFTYSYEIEKIAITLSSRSETKMYYVQFDIMFDCPSLEAKNQMILRRAQVRDTIFETARDFMAEDFTKTENFKKFKNAIMSNLKKFLGKNKPREIVIKNWLIN